MINVYTELELLLRMSSQSIVTVDSIIKFLIGLDSREGRTDEEVQITAKIIIIFRLFHR